MIRSDIPDVDVLFKKVEFPFGHKSFGLYPIPKVVKGRLLNLIDPNSAITF